MIPFLLIGGALGILILSKMPQKLFENIIQVIVVLWRRLPLFLTIRGEA